MNSFSLKVLDIELKMFTSPLLANFDPELTIRPFTN